MMKHHLLIAALALCVASCKPRNPGAETPAAPSTKPGTEAIAKCLRQYTGLTDTFPIEKVEPASLTGLKLPFLAGNFSGQSGIKVTLGPARLILKSAAPGSVDQYLRRFVVTLDASASRVLTITSTYDGPLAADVIPDPPLSSIEGQLAGNSEKYTALPPAAPQTTFLDALNAVDRDGVSSPLRAKEIDGLYVMRSSLGRPPQADWIIMTRGGEPPRPRRPEDMGRGRVRNIIDDETGHWAGADTLPLPRAQ